MTQSENPPAIPASEWRADLVVIVVLAAFIVLSRLPYIVPFESMGRDGPLYVHSLKLDSTYDVPMPGNIGFVVAARLVQSLFPDPVMAYGGLNIALAVAGVSATYLVGRFWLPRPVAAAAAFALATNTVVWWHGGAISSYLVWLATLPLLGYFGLRFVRDRRCADALAASVVLGVGSIFRQDMLMFGGPLWLGCLLLGRARLRLLLAGGLIVAACCAVWLGAMSTIFGGLDIYLTRVRAKHDWHVENFSFQAKGLFEGLTRNGVKYLFFLVWSAGLVVVPAALGIVARLGHPLRRWRPILLGLLWVAPSLWFSFFIFTGNAGLIFPALPLVYLGAADGLRLVFRDRSDTRASIALVLLALASTVQFTASPLPRETDQRQAILNVTFFKYSGTGLRAFYNYGLLDFDIDTSLKTVVAQMRHPQPVPKMPAGR